MTQSLTQLSAIARRAAQSRGWTTVGACANEILRRDGSSPEGHFLAGLVEKAAQRPLTAARAFATALELDAGRYDAAIELASQYVEVHRYAEALDLLRRYESHLENSPRYLNAAGLTYSMLGLHGRAWPLYHRANELQPDVPIFQANLAACGVYLGKIAEAKAIYTSLLQRVPTHQRNHYELSQLERAKDGSHVEQMQEVLRATNLPPDKNIFLYYAIGKELEDLGKWQEAFHHYRMAGDAVTGLARLAGYDVAGDIDLIDSIIEVCDADWLRAGPDRNPTDVVGKTPIFIVGLPRTGTTLTERIVASHSLVESIGETQFMQRVLRLVSGVKSTGSLSPAVIEAATKQDINLVANGYLNAVNYKLGDRPLFTEKLPENFLYLGFIAKAYPQARIVYLRRNPMDACFAMYKQSFFRFAYTLENLGRYYVAHDRLLRHWRKVLGERLIEIDYESLVADQEGQTRALLARLGLDFEPACLEFEKNPTASATASSVQVREKIHARSVNRWKHFEKELQPLRQMLESAGIAIE
jgi:tetratricopeptide (TPR) repeat protein